VVLSTVDFKAMPPDRSKKAGAAAAHRWPSWQMKQKPCEARKQDN